MHPDAALVAHLGDRAAADRPRPVFVVPPFALTKNGRRPARASASIAPASSRGTIRKSRRPAARAAARARKPEHPRGARRPRSAPGRRRRRRRPSLMAPTTRSRAQASAVMFATEPPLTSVPPASGGKPIQSLNQPSTSSSSLARPGADHPRAGVDVERAGDQVAERAGPRARRRARSRRTRDGRPRAERQDLRRAAARAARRSGSGLLGRRAAEAPGQLLGRRRGAAAARRGRSARRPACRPSGSRCGASSRRPVRADQAHPGDPTSARGTGSTAVSARGDRRRAAPRRARAPRVRVGDLVGHDDGAVADAARARRRRRGTPRSVAVDERRRAAAQPVDGREHEEVALLVAVERARRGRSARRGSRSG